VAHSLKALRFETCKLVVVRQVAHLTVVLRISDPMTPLLQVLQGGLVIKGCFLVVLISAIIAVNHYIMTTCLRMILSKTTSLFTDM
jgi:hypothetical protein